MRNLLLVIVMAANLNACGDVYHAIDDGIRDAAGDREFDETDPIFNIYIEEFTTVTGRNVVDIPINFDYRGGDIAGTCIQYGSGGLTGKRNKEILIDTAYWDLLNENSKSELIMHELGHCVMGLDHFEEVYDIMNSGARTNESTDNGHDYLIESFVERYVD